MANPIDQYLGTQYLGHNPSWDLEDSPWKAQRVADLLHTHLLTPPSICEIGCGAGGCLAELRRHYPDSQLYGYDIAPDAQQFWRHYADLNIHFQVGDFFKIDSRHYHTMLILDVIEHVSDPFGFLERLRDRADYHVFHIPLDLSALTVLRETPLLHVRRTVGHIHYFTKNLALALLQECGYQVLDWHYTHAALTGPRRGWRTMLARLPRWLAYSIHKDLGVRLLGGETLLVLARPEQ